MSVRLRGRPAVPGVAVAPAFVLEASPEPEVAEPDRAASPEEHRASLEEAIEEAREQLEELAEQVTERAGEDQGAIFRAQAAFAADPELLRLAGEAIEAGAGAGAAVREAFGHFREMLAASESDYLAGRVTDLDDVRDRILAILAGADPGLRIPEEESVLVARDLTPSQTAGLPASLVTGIATESGSPTSHAAILARALGIPAVVGVEGLLEAVSPGETIALDGRRGEVVVAPDRAEREAFHERAEEEATRRERLAQLTGRPAETADGHRVELAANLGAEGDLEAALEAGAEGSGLVRTEFLFLDREEPPSVEEQADFYRRTLEAFPDHRVVFRTLDAGADKPLPFLPDRRDPNPALGLRGIRLGLAMPELLEDQLRAVLRASPAGRAAVMFPLVATVEELHRARDALEKAAEREGADPGGLEVGIMVEVPSAALAAGRLAQEADFLSVGTNDLLQYLFAADRLVPEVASLPDACDPAVLRLLEGIVEAAHAEGAWVGVCGEAAAAPLMAAALVGMGVDELSMAPAAIPEIKDLLRQVRHADLTDAVRQAMRAPGPAEARRHLRETLPESHRT